MYVVVQYLVNTVHPDVLTGQLWWTHLPSAQKAKVQSKEYQRTSRGRGEEGENRGEGGERDKGERSGKERCRWRRRERRGWKREKEKQAKKSLQGFLKKTLK